MTDDSMKAASEVFTSLKSESLDTGLTETAVAVRSAVQFPLTAFGAAVATM